MPFLKPILEKLQKNGLVSIILIMLVLSIIRPQFSSVILETFTRYFTALCYISIGYYLSENKSKWLLSKTLGSILFLTAFIITLVSGLGFFKEENFLTFDYQSYSAFHLLPKSIGVYILIKALTHKISPIVQLIISVIGRYSFGIYLIHPLVLHLLNKMAGISYKFVHPSIGIPFTALLCLLLSFAFLYYLDKTSIGKYTY